MTRPWILIAGPYTAGMVKKGQRKRNLTLMNVAAGFLFDRGYLPIVGVNAARPMIKVMGDERYDDMMMPMTLALAERCDAVLRISGNSDGADKQVAFFAERNRPIYYNLDDIPPAKDFK